MDYLDSGRCRSELDFESACLDWTAACLTLLSQQAYGPEPQHSFVDPSWAAAISAHVKVRNRERLLALIKSALPLSESPRDFFLALDALDRWLHDELGTEALRSTIRNRGEGYA